MPLTFVLGGARSGKSALAVRLASTFDSPVVVVATAEARDDEMAERIRRHRESRPFEWKTVEAPLELAATIRSLPEDASIVLDCLTVWVSNALEAEHGDDGAILGEAEDVATTLAERFDRSVVVSNEVGLGIVPANALARRYRDVLGEVNAIFARIATRSFFMVAGRAIPLAPPELP